MAVLADANGGRGTLLIVEDETPIRFLMETALKRAGFRVLAASCGAEGLNLFFENASAIDLLITDLSLPKIRGDELAQRAREIRPDLHVLLASGSFRMESFVRDHFVEGSGFLAKPFSMGQLLQAVNGMLNPDTTLRPVLHEPEPAFSHLSI